MRSCAESRSESAIGNVDETDLVLTSVDQGGTLTCKGGHLWATFDNRVIVHLDQIAETEVTIKHCETVERVKDYEVLVALNLVTLELHEVSPGTCLNFVEVVVQVNFSISFLWLSRIFRLDFALACIDF